MGQMNRCEAEIDAIREKLYEETKHLTREERIRRGNERGAALAAKYGFKIGRPGDRNERELRAGG